MKAENAKRKSLNGKAYKIKIPGLPEEREKIMGLIDVFEKEERTEIKLSQLCEILRAGAKAELLMNAVNCDVPHLYIREMATGEKETSVLEAYFKQYFQQKTDNQ